MKTLMVLAGSIPKSFIITVLLLLNIVNILIINGPLWLTMTISISILLLAATLIMHTLQKSNEIRDRMEAQRLKRN